MTILASAELPAAQVQPDPGHHAGPATPGQPDMWVLVMIEAITFSAYFVVYTVCYRNAPSLFLESQSQLDLAFGALNTYILLTSSWMIARCVERSRAGDWKAASTNLWLTAGGGLLFCALKLYEWSVEMGKGFTFTTNQFFSFYYFLTGIHLLHVLVGFIALGVIYYQLKSPARRSQELIETGATYWHMVDFLWVIIFALLYVMR
jgi:nitric oxide reductase NorE protein